MEIINVSGKKCLKIEEKKMKESFEDKILVNWAKAVKAARSICDEKIAAETRKIFRQLLFKEQITAVWIINGDRPYAINYPKHMGNLSLPRDDKYCFFDEEFFAVVRAKDLIKVRKVSNGYILTMLCVSIHRISEVK